MPAPGDGILYSTCANCKHSVHLPGPCRGYVEKAIKPTGGEPGNSIEFVECSCPKPWKFDPDGVYA